MSSDDEPKAGAEASALIERQFTDRSHNVLKNAASVATELRRSQTSADHLFVALTMEKGSVASQVLKQFGVTQTDAVDAVKTLSHDQPPELVGARQTLSQESEQLIAAAKVEAAEIRQTYIGTEHLLLAFTRAECEPGQRLFSTLGIEPTSVRNQVLSLLGSGK